MVGETFGSGNGLTTFNLPDLRGEFIRGFDSGRNVDSGRVFGSFQDQGFKSHSHSTIHTLNKRINGDGSGQTNYYLNTTPTSNLPYSNTTDTGGTETRPRNIALLYCIKT